MTISFEIEPITRTDNLLLVIINEDKRKALRIVKNQIKIFGLRIDLDSFGVIPIFRESKQLVFNFVDKESEDGTI